MQVRLYEFDVGVEASVQPDAGSPTLANDLVTLGYAQANFSGAPLISGSRASPNDITVTGLNLSTLFPTLAANHYDLICYVRGNGGAIDITTNPQIQNGAVEGRKLKVIGCHDTQTLKFDHGTGLTKNGPTTLRDGSVLEFIYLGATLGWTETFYNGI